MLAKNKPLRLRVSADCVSFASPRAGKLSHFVAPTSKTEPAALGFGFVERRAYIGFVCTPWAIVPWRDIGDAVPCKALPERSGNHHSSPNLPPVSGREAKSAVLEACACPCQGYAAGMKSNAGDNAPFRAYRAKSAFPFGGTGTLSLCKQQRKRPLNKKRKLDFYEKGVIYGR